MICMTLDSKSMLNEKNPQTLDMQIEDEIWM